MSDNKVLELFRKLEINLNEGELSYFEHSEIEKASMSSTKSKLKLSLKIKNFLPIRVLSEIHSKCVGAEDLKIKLILNVQQQRIDKEILCEYIDFIKNEKAQNKTVIWNFIDSEGFDYDADENIIKFIVDSNELKNQLSIEMNYCLAKLTQFGFKDLNYEIEVEDKTEEYIKQSLIIEQQTKEQYKQFAPEQTEKSQSIIVSRQNSQKWNQSLDKPSYETFEDIEEDAQNIVLHGKVMSIEIRDSKANNRKIYSIGLTDNNSSIKCIYFGKEDERTIMDPLTEEELTSDRIDEIRAKRIAKGDWIAVKGKTSYSQFDREQNFIIDKIGKISRSESTVKDEAAEKRVELHVHTKMSAMDGVSSIQDYLQMVDKWNWKAIAVTDHINVQTFPDAYNELRKINKNKADEDKLKLIYGLEMNMIQKEDYWIVKNPKGQKIRESKMVIFDLETTGLSPEFNEIIEFGAVVLDPVTGKTTKHDYLFKPKEPLKQFTIDLTNITPEMLDDKKNIEDDFAKIYDLIKDSILIAHNANFDFNFLNALSKRLGYGELENTVIDTLTLSRMVRPALKSHRLGAVCKKFGILYDEHVAHRADYDADVLNDLFFKIMAELKLTTPIIFDNDLMKLEPENDKENVNLLRSRGVHVNVLAKNQQGLKDIFKLVSISHTDNFFNSPKVFKEKLKKIKEKNNILIGAGCVNSEVFEIARIGTDQKLEEIMPFYDYIEIQPLSVYKNLINDNQLEENELINVINKIIKLAKKHNVMLVATSDAHYTRPELKKIRDVYINAKGLGGSRHPLFSFKNKNKLVDYPDQYLRTTNEMLKEFAWLNDATLINEMVITNTNKIADMIDSNIVVIKDGLFTPNIENVDTLLKNKCYETAHAMYGEVLPEIVEARLEKELTSIIKHGFAVVYWISHLLVEKSNNDGYLVGSRGSVGSSFVATTSNITEVNPLKAHYRCLNCKYSDFNTPIEIKCGYDLPEQICPKCNEKLIGDGHDIPFETFLGFDGDKVPDIDLNFSGEYQPIAHNFTKEMFGEDNVFRAGTISTVAEKTAFGYVKAFYEENGVLEEDMPRKIEIERQAKLVEGVKRTTGQHPGGIIILPKEFEIEDFTPVNFPADDATSSWKTTHFDFHSIHDNLLKMDILGHVDPTALRMLKDLTGVNPISIPTNDPKVYSLFSDLSALNIKPEQINGEKTGAIGLPEFGTGFVRSMLRETKPKTFADLVQISGLSHGTDVWLGNARDLIKNDIANISTVIGCRDDIMVYLMGQGIDATTSFKIMESVRKGQGLRKEWKEIMLAHNVPEWYIESCLKIKYMFPKAHATAYVLMAYRIAWYKIYYPAEYYATFLTNRADAFDLKTFLGGYNGVKEKLAELESRKSRKDKMTTKELALMPVLEIGLEMFSRGIKMANLNFEKSLADKYIIEKDETTGEATLYPPFLVIDSLGDAVADSIIKARSERPLTSVKDLTMRTTITQTQMKIFEQLNVLDTLAQDEQLEFDFFN
ncbi:PolC-type DNA polymerase III [Mesoplasma coleopterae]|uniref:PolC-type DNA polymerase III n=1 Tax=Mesoplasma coleopterae TaxID=324078 RepID=UPI000D025253|nr:PolC-type DNA polymerase III [Mesoplasma coleopterae]AVN62325.1 PolC-type DNA polymerase III [Mesoplasma coleopterae]